MDKAVFDVVCIGNYTKDTIVSPAGTRHVDGGGSRYAAYAARQLGRKAAVITCLAREDEHVVENLRQDGIACFPTWSAQSTLMNLTYPTSNPDIRSLTVGGVADAITVSAVRAVQMRAAVIGASLRGEVGLDVITHLHAQKVLLAADVQGYIRVLHGQELVNEPWEEMQATLALVDILKSDAVEAAFLTGETDIFRAAYAFAEMGPKEIVLTHKDGVLIHAGGEFHDLKFHAARLDGRSGRGDTCIGAYTSMRLEKEPLEAGIWAAAVTSLKVEQLGIFRQTRADVEALIRAKYNHITTY